MTRTAPTPHTWTFRLKYHKSTTILHIDPLQSLTSIKTELLSALNQTHPDGRLHGAKIPSVADDIILGRSNDPYDPSSGWTRIEEEDPTAETDDGLALKKRKNTTRDALSPKTLGLKDNAVLAFKFRADDDEGLGLEEEKWDVVIASYEDVTGTTNEGDVGALQDKL